MVCSGKIWFCLNGHVTTQNNWYESTEGPHFIHRFPLHGIIVGVCAPRMWGG
jgi:hypothetical protein